MTLYLKYRPVDFDNLVGQDFINSTLKKAIATDKTVGAYLFCGPRWTGKTSTARLFAKTINCPHQVDGNPCLKCDICIDFQEESLVDIIEIDAASHTGVDNIREIIEKAQFTPTHTQYKVYIIDEVHMLSKGAFNALLKILEEPPKHVKFVLATTETHKVPETIISRCQRYDFKRISDREIQKRLEYVAKQEGITIDELSLNYIVKNSGGGLRNALSLFEQLIEDNTIKYETIIEKLGIVDDDILSGFYDKLISNDSSIIQEYESLITDGKNISLFMKELIFYIKDIMIEKVKESDSIHSELHILDILNDSYSKSKHSLDETTTFLVGLLKITTPESKQTAPPQSPPIKVGGSSKKEKPEALPLLNKEGSEVVKKEVEPNSVSHDDIADMFGDDTISSAPQNSPVTSTQFDTNNFITQLKKSWAKWALTMALRGSQITLRDDSLTIHSKTTIARNQISNNDHKNMIRETMDNMWYSNISLITE